MNEEEPIESALPGYGEMPAPEPEVVAAPEAGLLAEDRSAACLQRQIAAVLAALPDRVATRAYAERFAWDETVEGVLRLFRRAVVAERRRA